MWLGDDSVQRVPLWTTVADELNDLLRGAWWSALYSRVSASQQVVETIENKVAVLKAASYARASASQQVVGNSCEWQEETNVSLAESMGYIVSFEYRLHELVSGTDGTRPKLNLLISLVENKDIEAVFIQSLDRLSRDPVQVLKFVLLCRDHSVELWAGNEKVGGC